MDLPAGPILVLSSSSLFPQKLMLVTKVCLSKWLLYVYTLAVLRWTQFYKCSLLVLQKRFLLWAPLSTRLLILDQHRLVGNCQCYFYTLFPLFSQYYFAIKSCIIIVTFLGRDFFPSSLIQCALDTTTSGYLKNYSDGNGWQCSIWSNQPKSSMPEKMKNVSDQNPTCLFSCASSSLHF